MKLVRIEEDARFYYVVIGEELLPFDIIVPADQRLMMPMHAEEYLPALTVMLSRGNLVQRQHSRLLTAAPDQFKPFRRSTSQVVLAAPVNPGSIREVVNPFKCDASKGAAPLYQYINVGSIASPIHPVELPSFARAVVPKIQVAAVVGSPGTNILLEEADQYIAGYTIITTLIEPVLRNEEAGAGMGPGKSSDFASLAGPILITADELVQVNSETSSSGTTLHMTTRLSLNGGEPHEYIFQIPWTFAQILSYASTGSNLFAGDMFTVQVVPDSAIVELLGQNGDFLQSGDELCVEVVGVGEHTVAIK